MKIVLLDSRIHQRETFDCGNQELNSFLQKTANQQLLRDQARTYVLVDENVSEKILGFYTLAMCQLETAQLPSDLQKKHKFAQSAGLLARLAVDISYQNKGYGKTLLLDALQKMYQASQLVGFPLIFVDTKSGKKAFYQQYGFCSLPDPSLENKLYITVETLRRSLIGETK